MYQRSKIQEESLYYETLKHNGDFPIIGVNTFLSSKGSKTVKPGEIIRAATEETENQINTLQNQQEFLEEESKRHLERLQEISLQGGNIFSELMEASKYCTLGQITSSLFEVGGQYRRNM